MLSDESPADVPTTHIYSRTDGVVHWESCIDSSGAPTVENVEVMGSHVGMGLNPDVYRLIADRLAMPRRSRLRAANSRARCRTGLSAARHPRAGSEFER